ncbi:MAG: hypothetical protein ABIT47_04305 [Candidatus Paceibacterota bacterium]
MFYVVLFILEGMVLSEAFLAYRDGFLYRGQGNWPRPGNRISFYIEHGGMWGDLIIVSPLVAAVTTIGLPYWLHNEWAVSGGLISVVLTVAMILMWSASSKNLDDAFMRDTLLKPCGAVHAVYMFFAISVLILFYWFTPVTAATWHWRYIASLLLAVHVILGIIIPDIVTNGRVGRNTWLTTLGAWAVIAVSYWRPYIF